MVDFDFSGVQRAFESGLSAAAGAGKQVSRGIGDGAAAVARAGQEVAHNVGNGAASVVDTGKKAIGKTQEALSSDQIVEILDTCYGKAMDGIPHVSESVEDMVKDYTSRYSTPRKAAEALINTQILKCTTSGFLTSLGGLITLPVAVPANLGTVWYCQLRMIAAVAQIGGFDPRTDQVQTMTYVCMTGQAMSDVLKDVGIQLGGKLATSAVKKVPGKALTKINQAVGFRLITKFGQKGVINIGELIPVVGGVIGGGVDLVTTKVIADNAMKMFINEQQ